MGPKSEKAYQEILKEIEAGHFRPGEKLPSERTLTGELGIGRTALRQVLSRLVSEGFVEVHERSSYRVSMRGTINHLGGKLEAQYGKTYATLINHISVSKVYDEFGIQERDEERDLNYLLAAAHFLVATSGGNVEFARMKASEHLVEMTEAIRAEHPLKGATGNE